MDPQINERLKAIEDKIEENSKLLKKVRSTQRAGHYMRIGYWAILILAGFGALYFIKPVLGQLGDAYGITGAGDNVGNPSSFTTSGLLDQIKQFKDLSSQNQGQ